MKQLILYGLTVQLDVNIGWHFLFFTVKVYGFTFDKSRYVTTLYFKLVLGYVATSCLVLL